MTTPNKPAADSNQRIVGAAPLGTRDEASAAAAVREMFTSIAPRYDLLNHVLSMNVDRLWWNRTARLFSEVLRRPDAQVLDLCCGTGDMAFALYRRLDGAPTRIIGADFSHAMLVRAEQKSASRNIRWVEADALHLPLAFGEPKGLLGKLYRVYFRRVLPAIGTLISGVRGPYAYLPASVLRFPSPGEMLERMRAVGFREVSWTPYTFGIAGLYRGRK